ncbi:transporter substrate-binding domain-containing protein [Endozoicomonas sp. SM1973]|uniref:Transporter substrate-binding domain-containing protein n=1 Tax=Spartinivicinus marinus TaxID=2994442 RepID=A0A853HUX6_9GAMM|nr:transporter substrate-binding domain-containing protein [Spartinivicinus marinus]MCX4029479.1 transporter substrate-binding domain-containing protein [Spartinivicinus marinus]NYZ65053.1 transporter substrate-binding domain-containing protein [Spartinivicinus marinus]
MRFPTLALYILLSVKALSVFAAEPITLATGEYPPYNSVTFQHYGLMPKIITEAFATVGYQVNFVFLPWSKAYYLSKIGNVDGTAQWFNSEERKIDHIYSHPILSEKVVWFYLREYQFDWKTLDDLTGIRICALRGFTYTHEFHRAIRAGNLHVSFVNYIDQCFKMILAGRTDITLENIEVAYYKLRSLFKPELVSQFVYHQKPFQVSYNHLLISKKTLDAQKIINDFNRGLKQLKTSGKINQILKNSRMGLYEPKQ